VASLPHWNELALQFQDKPVVFIAISDENKDVVTSFLKRRTISSWVGLEGITQSTRDRYGIHGIPTIIIVNQEGIAVARTHPVHLEAKHIQEVLDTKRSSLPPPQPEESADNSSGTVPVAKQPALFEISIRRSGARIPGHGYKRLVMEQRPQRCARRICLTQIGALSVLPSAREPVRRPGQFARGRL
jgi:hypothetical protein